MATGCYTPRYLPASFKGAPFVAEDVSSEHGRRGAEGEFPFGEITGYADLGRKIRRYKLRGRLQENNHIGQAAALIAACESVGPGPLVHPTRGVIIAACKSLKVTDKVEDSQGVTEVDMEFVEGNSWPSGFGLFGTILGIALGAFFGAASGSFRNVFRPGLVQPQYEDRVKQTAQAAVAQIRDRFTTTTIAKARDTNRNLIIYDLNAIAAGQTPISLDVPTNVLSPSSTTRYVVIESLVAGTEILNQPTASSRTFYIPQDVHTLHQGILRGMNALASELYGVAKFNTFKKLANWAAQTSAIPGAAGDAENAVYSLVRAVAAGYMAQGAQEVDTARSGDIFERADAVDSILASELSFAKDTRQNEYLIEIAKFKADAYTTLCEKALTSPGTVEFHFAASTHPLVAAYQIHGDAKRHREVREQNVVNHYGRIGHQVYATVF